MKADEKYLANVRIRLHVDKKNRERIINGLRTEIEYALEKGESIENILKRMGSPAEMANSYNDTYKNDIFFQKKKTYKIVKVVAIASLVASLLFLGVILISILVLPADGSISQVGGVSGPAIIETTSRPLTLFEILRPYYKYTCIPLSLFVLSTLYYITEKIKQKRVRKNEKK